MASPTTPLCKCGEALPAAGKGANAGAPIVCGHCQRKYKYLSSTEVEPINNAKSVRVGDAEVFRFDTPGEAEKGDEASGGGAGSVKDLRERKRIAEKRRSVATARASGQAIPESTTRPRGRPKQEIPGGVMPMVIFIVVFNALAFIALHFLFPNVDGVIHTPWGSTFTNPRIPWLEMIALLLGHVFGFMGWAVYVHRLTLKKKAAAARARAEANSEDELRGERA
jgi:hypothetical protein